MTNVRRTCPTNTIHPPNAGSMLGQRRKRWTNIEEALGLVCWVAFTRDFTHLVAITRDFTHSDKSYEL